VVELYCGVKIGYDPRRELLWSWASVHHDGIEHMLHDHPASLLSGTVYLQVWFGRIAMSFQK
jgi:hypothetical protein